MSRKNTKTVAYESDDGSEFESSDEEFLLKDVDSDDNGDNAEPNQFGGEDGEDDEGDDYELEEDDDDKAESEDDRESDADSEADTELRDAGIESDGENVEEAEDTETTTVAGSKTCHLKDLDKEFLVLDEDDSAMYGKMKYVRIPDEDRISEDKMTYYEMVRILGTRAQQFNYGAPPLVKGLDGMAPVKMAYVELISNMTPYIVRRHLPGKRYEEWRVSELVIDHVISDKFFVPENFDLDKYRKHGEEVRRTFKEKSEKR